MGKRARRIVNLVFLPPSCALSSALLAPAFRNDPALMGLMGLIAGLVVGAIILAIVEA